MGSVGGDEDVLDGPKTENAPCRTEPHGNGERVALGKQLVALPRRVQ